MIRLLCSDFDNTLAHRTRLHPDTVTALKALEEAGIAFCIVTGRLASNIRGLLAAYGIHCHIVADNGAYSLWKGKEEAGGRVIDPEDVKRIMTLCEKHRWPYFLYDKEICYLPDDLLPFLRWSWVQRIISHVMKSPVQGVREGLLEGESGQVYKALVFPRKSDTALAKEVFGKEEGLWVTSSSKRKVELCTRGVDKWFGIRPIMDKLGITANEVACIGDYDNDLEMLEACGLPCAVANANEKVKRVAKLVFPSAKEGGVAKLCDYLREEGREETKNGN